MRYCRPSLAMERVRGVETVPSGLWMTGRLRRSMLPGASRPVVSGERKKEVRTPGAGAAGGVAAAVCPAASGGDGGV